MDQKGYTDPKSSWSSRVSSWVSVRQSWLQTKESRQHRKGRSAWTGCLSQWQCPTQSFKMHEASKQKIEKVVEYPNNRHRLIEVHTDPFPTTAEPSLSVAGTFKTDHILKCKAILNRLKRIKIIQSMFSNNNGIKLETYMENSQLSGKQITTGQRESLKKI